MYVKTQVYVAGLLLGVFQIGDWSIIKTLSKFSIHSIDLNSQTCLLAQFSLFAR